LAGERIGWGILGAAHIAGRAVLDAIDASSNGRIVAMASRDPKRAREMLAPYSRARVLDSYAALLTDPEVDAVYNPLPNSLHKEWSIRALQAGKHVLCEKPIALNAREAEEMAAAAEKADRHLMEGFMYRFHPPMRDLVQRARDAIYVDVAFGFTVRNDRNIRLMAEMGGGALLDVGCYAVSVARWILGEPENVTAVARVRNGVDVTTSAFLTFRDGMSAAAWSSLESAEVQELTVITRDAVLRRSRAFNSREEHDPYQLMLESFGDSVLHDRPLAIPMSESIANMRVLDRIAAAARA
jgi:D-xylose 1-dehydrogenase (NADP+, D-xylono-1,5-lactone-forming)